MKNKKILAMIIGVIVVLVIGIVLFYHWGISAPSSQDEEVIVQIEQGSNASTILNTLDEAGLVNNKLCGKIFLKLNSYDHLQANTYIFNKNMSLSKIYSI
ncbi:MAG: endolytic transglycosylase MltG, partial [Erysipelotrichales bacterium]|nr:endolytic transglycosylase MltG [Erysipelotrichales bacterium]